MADANTTAVLDKVVQKGAHAMQGIDIGLFQWIQTWVNKLYAGKYGSFFAISVLGIPVANIIAAVAVLLFFLMLRKVFSSWVVALLLRLARRTETTLDDMLVQELKGPIRFLFVVLGLQIFFRLLFLDSGWVELLLESAMIYTVFWALYALTPATRAFLSYYRHGNDHLSYELTGFLVRLLRMLIVFFGLVAILYNFGINVTAFFASLGIGGLALALAAKDTAANLFGSIALLVDRSVKVGEWIRVNEIEGTVEDIGMRTTKIRTFEKSLIAIPNSIVATSPIENYSRRGIRRIKMSIGLPYDTPRETLHAIIADLRALLEHHPDIAQDANKLVYFRDFNSSDLGVLIYAFAIRSEWKSYLEIREDLNFKIMQIVQKHGASFAFPSRSLYVESLPQTPPSQQEPA